MKSFALLAAVAFAADGKWNTSGSAATETVKEKANDLNCKMAWNYTSYWEQSTKDGTIT